MANVSLKKDFTDGEKLFGQQLNNNFGAIEAALGAMNKINWQDNPDDSVIVYRGTTEAINARDIEDGQILYDTTTGETYIDYNNQRISTGSGNAIHIGNDLPTNPSTQLWINPDEPIQVLGSEVVDNMNGDEIDKAPSVRATKEYVGEKIIDSYSSTEVLTNKIWTDNSPIYRKVVDLGYLPNNTQTTVSLNISHLGKITHFEGLADAGGTLTTGGELIRPMISFTSIAMGDSISCYVSVSDNVATLVINTRDDFSAYKGFLIIEYTKNDSNEEVEE